MVEKCIRDFLMLWATIDPIGTMALFLAVTASATPKQRNRHRLPGHALFRDHPHRQRGRGPVRARRHEDQSGFAGNRRGHDPLPVRRANGLWNEAKPPTDDPHHDPAIFPMAIPSIAGPGSIMAAILLTDNDKFEIHEQALTATILIVVLLATYVLMRFGEIFLRILGKNGAAILVRIMGMLLAALAVEMAIEGLSRQIAKHAGGS